MNRNILNQLVFSVVLASGGQLLAVAEQPNNDNKMKQAIFFWWRWPSKETLAKTEAE